MADGEDEAVGEMSDGLQVELFHPDSDREPGDTNIQRFGFDVHPVVFPIALLIIALFILVTVFYQTIAAALGWTMVDSEGEVVTQNAADAYSVIFDFIGANFGWFYLLVVNVFIVVLLYFALSKYGNIRIGGVEAEKEFTTSR